MIGSIGPELGISKVDVDEGECILVDSTDDAKCFGSNEQFKKTSWIEFQTKDGNSSSTQVISSLLMVE